MKSRRWWRPKKSERDQGERNAKDRRGESNVNGIPAPGYGALEGAPEIHEPDSPESAGAPRICATCSWFAPLSPGHAAICFERWRHLPWNAAVPLVKPNDSCDQHALKRPEGKVTMAIPTFTINLDKKCAECGSDKAGVADNGLCLGCTTKALRGFKKMKSAQGRAVAARFVELAHNARRAHE